MDDKRISMDDEGFYLDREYKAEDVIDYTIFTVFDNSVNPETCGGHECESKDETFYYGIRPNLGVPEQGPLDGLDCLVCIECAAKYSLYLKSACTENCKIPPMFVCMRKVFNSFAMMELSRMSLLRTCYCRRAHICMECLENLHTNGYICSDCKPFGQYTKPVKR